MRHLHIHFLAGLVPAPLDELFISIEMFVIITIVRRLELHFIIVLLGGLVGLPFSSESFDDALGLRGLGRVRVGVDEVDDLRVVSWCRRDSSPSCLLYTSPSPRDRQKSRMPSSA